MFKAMMDRPTPESETLFALLPAHPTAADIRCPMPASASAAVLYTAPVVRISVISIRPAPARSTKREGSR